MTADARIDEIRAWLSTLPEYTTHSADCWRWHPRCVARLLLAEIDRNTLHLNAADSLAFAEALIAADEREAALIRVSQIGEAMNIGCGTADCLTDYADLIERLEKAAEKLDAERAKLPHPRENTTPHVRLQGKAEGVRLALSYIKEQQP